MWKLLVAFVVFAAIALFMLKKLGGNVDMGGEKHGVETAPAVEAASAAAPASAASALLPASAASN